MPDQTLFTIKIKPVQLLRDRLKMKFDNLNDTELKLYRT